MINLLKKKLFRDKSLEKTVLLSVIAFTVVFTIVIITTLLLSLSHIKDEYISSYLFYLTILVLIIIVFLVWFIIFFTKRILKNIFDSLNRFEDQVSNIANGDYEEELQYGYFLELNKLSFSILKMRDKIKQREINLNESLKNFKILINSTMEGIIIHDTKVCIDINDVALRILDYENKEDLIGKDIYKHISMKHKKDAINFFQKKKYFFKAREYELIRKDKKVIKVLAQARVIFYCGKEYRISAFLDITDFKEQQNILFLQARLASMGEILSNIAHQWRQPLSTIRTISSGIKLEKELGVFCEDKLCGYLDNINENTRYLSKTLDEFSNYFKPNSQIEVFELSHIIKKSICFLKPSFNSNNIEVVSQLENELFVKGYPSELMQVLLNIFTNSKEAFISKNIKNRLIIVSTYEEDKKIIVSIKDSALGLNNFILSKIFEPYYTSKHKAQGVGLGLYMAHQIVTRQMQGVIFARNCTFSHESKNYKGLEVILKINL